MDTQHLSRRASGRFPYQTAADRAVFSGNARSAERAFRGFTVLY